MKFEEIIKSNNWLSVETILLKIYPGQIESISSYKRFFEQLQEIEAEASEIEIIIEQCYDDETGEPTIGNVYGIDKNSKDEFTNSVAIEFTRWRKWLGMTVGEMTVKEFTELEIIAHCLYEMTFCGYNEEEIQKEFSKIEGIADQYKNLTPEEKALTTKQSDFPTGKITPKLK